MNEHVALDAGSDGLGVIRDGLQHEVTRRWTQAAREVKRAILQSDALGIGDKAPRLAQPTSDKAHMFKRWLDEKLLTGVAAYDGRWLKPPIEAAAAHGTARVGIGDAAPSSEVCHAAAAGALADICEDVSNRAHMSVASGLMIGARPSQIAQMVNQAFGHGLQRTRLLAEHAVTMAHAQATLDALEASGVTHVGTISEHRRRLHDYDPDQPRDDDGKWAPATSVTAYKLFERKGEQLYPLFIGSKTPVEQGKWLQANFIPTKGYAERPGWHAGILPIAPHLRTKAGEIAPSRVWAEVELPADVDYQAEAESSSTRDIRGKVPAGGFYKFKTNKMQGGAWMIGGALKVKRTLSDPEVKGILSKAGYSQAEIAGEMHRYGIKDYDPDEPRDEQGRWTTGGGHGYEFVSPNVGNIGFGEARGALAGRRESTMLEASGDVDRAVGISGVSNAVIGAWADGAEHSTMTVVDHADWDTLRLAAAMKGHLADQKQVLIFKEAEESEHAASALYSFDAQGDLGAIHQRLLDDGVAFHTLQPTSDGAKVWIADIERSVDTMGVVQKAAHGAHVDVRDGKAEFLGTTQETGTDREQRDDARRAYDRIIQESAVQGAAEKWQGLHHRWAKTLQELTDALRDAFDPDQPRDDLGKWTVSYSGRQGQYDPKFFRAEDNPLEDEHGVVVGNKQRLVAIREANDRPPIEDDPNLMYRGMSHAEYEAFRTSGEIKTQGDYNLSSQSGLTYFTTESRAAETYANAFAPWAHKPDFGKPAYIVAAKRVGAERLKRVQGTGEHELGVMGPVAKSDVVGVWRGTVIARDPGEKDRLAPDAWLHWQKVTAALDAMFDAWFEDAARKTPQPRHPKHGRFEKAHVVARELRRSKSTGRFRRQGLAPDEQRREELREARFGRVRGKLDVQTQGDDRVCDRCDEISDNGPYTINKARGLIPAHINCRCLFVAAGTMRDAWALADDWAVVGNDVIPLGSVRKHTYGFSCWCHPDDDDGVVVHHQLADFDPNQPRDPEGKWTAGGGGAPDLSTLEGRNAAAEAVVKKHETQGGAISRIFLGQSDPTPPKGWHDGLKLYHGTSMKAANDILAHGLIAHASPGGDAWAATHGMSAAEVEAMTSAGGRRVSVYMTDDKKFAMKFAHIAAEMGKSKAIMFEIDVPPDQAKNLKQDEWSATSHAYRYEGTIPPEWIHRTTTPTEEYFAAHPVKVVKDADQPKKIYMVLFVDGADDMADFDPDQPRDEIGRWTAGGGSTAPSGAVEVGGASDPENWILSPTMAKAPWVLEKAKKAVADAGYDPERVFLSLKPPKFKVGDKEYNTGGVAFTRGDGVDGEGNPRKQGDIVLYGQPDFAKDFPVRGVATHEAMHQKWQRVLDRWKVSSGELREMINPFIGSKAQDLENEDGVSAYSKSYWDVYKALPLQERGRMTPAYESAVHETLAEIARIDDEGDVHGMPSRSELTGKPIHPVWRHFYRTVNKAWGKLKPKTFDA